MQTNQDCTKGELIIMNTGKNGNPLKWKSSGKIKQALDSSSQKVRNHAYCASHFCAFYGGPAWNCDGTRREGVSIEQIIWAEDRVLGTMERRSSVV